MSSQRTMISFRARSAIFQVRAAAVAIRDGYVLLHRAETDAFWALPGGRVEIGETSEAALQREMLEETGARVRIERPLWIVENFFRYRDEVHELGFYFLVTLPADAHTNVAEQFFGFEDNGTRLIFQWYRIADLGSIEVQPSFLREGLKAPPAIVQHLVIDERGL
jgi:ADP-ribose pyrophosphatase YjhB (NUDIX family)